MERCDLKRLKLVAQGGEAEIYDLGTDKILRVCREVNEHALDTEKVLYPLLEEHAVCVPKIYEYSQIDGKAAVVMQKIHGGTMLGSLTKHPLGAVRQIKRMARMQAAVSEIEVSEPFRTIQGNVNYFVKQPPILEEKLMDFILDLFSELPKGNQLCHGDFHPGNILTQDGTDYIIDWSGAYRSSYLSDVAHTYLLLKCVPHIPGESVLRHKAQRIAGAAVAEAYRKEAQRLKPFDDAMFSKWTVVMAFLRVHYGMPSEKTERMKYIRTCWELNERKVDAAAWYTRI